MQRAMPISKKMIALGLSALISLLVYAVGAYKPAGEAQAEIAPNHPKVCFSPKGHCASIILNEIAKAKRSIRVQAYSFTSSDIAEALIAAEKRGVDVAVIVDKSQVSERYSVLDALTEAKLPLYVDYCCAIAHNKIMIIDGQRIITGSYNFTKAAESKNAENLLLINDPELAKIYTDNWNLHRTGAEQMAMR